MKKTLITINLSALTILGVLFLLGLINSDLKVQMKLTDLDRAGVIDEAGFSKHYVGQFRGVRSREFAHFLAEPWIDQYHAAFLVGSLLAMANLGIAIRTHKRQLQNPSP